MTQTLHFHALAAPGEAPEWIHLVPNGRFSGRDGRGPYLLADAASVIAASMAEGKVPVDENHSTDLAAPRGEPAPARGWIVEMEERADGIWGRVEWTPTGRETVSAGEYRGISPVFTAEKKSGRVVQVLRASLTNNPNLGALAVLHQSAAARIDLSEGHEMPNAVILSALGLAADADEAAVAAAAASHAADLARLAQHFGCVAQPAAILAAAEARSLAAVKPELVIELQAQLAEMQARAARGAATAFVDAAIAGGKPIAPLREHYIARHMSAPSDVEREIAALPSLHAGGVADLHAGRRAGGAGDGDGDEPTELEARVAKKMGLDPKKLAKHRREMAAKKEAA